MHCGIVNRGLKAVIWPFAAVSSNGRRGTVMAFPEHLYWLLQGSFGRVYLGKWQETTVAIKLLSQPLLPDQRGAGEHAGLGPSLQKLR